MSTEFEFRPSGTLEFEHIEVESLMEKKPQPGQQAADAAEADDKIDRDPLSINFGREKDSPTTAAERMLAGTTIDWLIAFPMPLRPKTLCDRYPHVANRLAQGWRDRALSAQALRQLVEDARWGSVGFPALIQGELDRLLKSIEAAPASR